ncbi:MAG: hypothetical protein D6731_11560, partial [Planctomycetota bacterium]
MKSYDRTHTKREADLEALRELIETHRVARRPGPAAGVPPWWGQFAIAYEEAVVREAKGAEREALLRLARCGRLGIVRRFVCGAERPAAEAWCGHPFCPACAQADAAHAAQSLRRRWGDSGRVLHVHIPIRSPGGPALPSRSAVAAVRDAWVAISRRVAAASGLPRLEGLPRMVVHPGGVTQIVRLPWRSRGGRLEDVAERSLARAVERTARHVGLRGVAATAVSATEGERRLVAAMTREAELFREAVAADLERLAALPRSAGDATHDAALRATARRWVGWVRARKREARRKLILGSKDALPAPSTKVRRP